MGSLYSHYYNLHTQRPILDFNAAPTATGPPFLPTRLCWTVYLSKDKWGNNGPSVSANQFQEQMQNQMPHHNSS